MCYNWWIGVFSYSKGVWVLFVLELGCEILKLGNFGAFDLGGLGLGISIFFRRMILGLFMLLIIVDERVLEIRCVV